MTDELKNGNYEYWSDQILVALREMNRRYLALEAEKHVLELEKFNLERWKENSLNFYPDLEKIHTEKITEEDWKKWLELDEETK